MSQISRSDDLKWIKAFDPAKRLLPTYVFLRVKRAFDLSVVILAMPFWLPIMGIIALLITVTSPGAPANW
jgi:lipopolysaccharide/colanic/teichoic acid biosynthesis glycosyltransferase